MERHLFLNPDVDVVALTRLRHIMGSLTQNARDIFRLLVQYQLQALEEVDTARTSKRAKDPKESNKTRHENAQEKGLFLLKF